MCILETDRLVLRRFTGADWRDLYEYLSNPSVVFYEPYEVFSKEDCQREAERRAQQEAFWAVCLKANQKMIGNVYFKRQEPHALCTWELGYVFNPVYYGHGYATESCRAIIHQSFAQWGAHRIVAMCNHDNTASWKLMERLGMRREAHLRQNIFFKHNLDGTPRWCDTYEYAILADEWPA